MTPLASELCDRTGGELAELLRAGETSAVEITRSCLERTEAVDERLHAFLTRTPEVALERAEELDVHRTSGAPQQAVACLSLIHI